MFNANHLFMYACFIYILSFILFRIYCLLKITGNFIVKYFYLSYLLFTFNYIYLLLYIWNLDLYTDMEVQI